MGVLRYLVTAAVAVVAIQIYKMFLANQESSAELRMPEDGWFGSGSKRADNENILPFKINVPDETLKDLTERLQKAKLPVSLEDSNDFEYGFNPVHLRKVVQYWKDTYSWRKWEAVINGFPQFTTEIEGLKIHFIHAKPPAGKYEKSVPLLVSHGWPGNIFEFYKIIPMLTDPKQHLNLDTNVAFEVIAPSVPGYGWSDSPRKKGFDQWATARIFRKLMLRLGLKKFFVHGGDWGSLISKNIAAFYPENVLGLHVNTLFVMPMSNYKTTTLSILALFVPPSYLFSSKADSFAYSVDHLKDVVGAEAGYFHLQATKPDTVGAALSDSPAGLAAYILEKFSTWVNRHYRLLPDGGLTEKLTMDEVLTVVMIYWVNGNIASSQRYYKENMRSPLNAPSAGRFLHVPTGVASFPEEMIYGGQPRELLAAVVNLTRFTEMPRGGHFAAFEEPKLLAVEIFRFLNELL